MKRHIPRRGETPPPRPLREKGKADIVREYRVGQERQRQLEDEGHARIRARGRGAIRQVQEVLRKAGEPIPPGLRLPTPKRRKST